jgi:hypothetical protein
VPAVRCFTLRGVRSACCGGGDPGAGGWAESGHSRCELHCLQPLESESRVDLSQLATNYPRHSGASSFRTKRETFRCLTDADWAPQNPPSRVGKGSTNAPKAAQPTRRVLLRTTRLVARSILSRSSGSASLILRTSRVACSAISVSGCRTVVRGGPSHSAIWRSS